MSLKYTDQLADRLAVYIHKRVQRTPVKVLRYGIKDLLHNALFAASLLLLSAVTGHAWEGLTAIIAFWTLRRFSGGFHLATDTRCTFFSAFMVIFAIYMPKIYWYNGFMENIVAFVLLVAYAPSGSQAPKELHLRFKVIALMIVGSNFFIQSGILANVFLVQALTTPLILQRIIHRFNL